MKTEAPVNTITPKQLFENGQKPQWTVPTLGKIGSSSEINNDLAGSSDGTVVSEASAS